MNTHAHLVESIAHSSMFQEFQRAFSEATGLPLTLRPAGNYEWKPTCALLTSCTRSCTGCLRSSGRVEEMPGCPFKLTEATVPVRLGHQVIGYLVTGRVSHQLPTEETFEAGIREMEGRGVRPNREKLRKAYFQTRVVSEQTLDSIAKLLAIYADHIAIKSNELVIRQANIEPVAVTRVKEFVQAHYQDDVSLADAAQAAHTSTFHLCKVFRKATGMCFTEFLSRTRVENAKRLLLRPNLRVSEIAYEVGFQSLTHFNRVFRKLVGESPSEYRASRSTLALAA